MQLTDYTTLETLPLTLHSQPRKKEDLGQFLLIQMKTVQNKDHQGWGAAQW